MVIEVNFNQYNELNDNNDNNELNEINDKWGRFIVKLVIATQ